jgi:hypothetical protein
MIATTREVEVIKSNEPQIKFKMEVSFRNMHKLIPLLRDSLYSNKKLAPLREYSTNAFDAHIEAGIASRPIQVTLPTVLEPELRIRDFGKGLNILELADIYFKYLETTKDNSNDYNGMLGLGSKSAFAYADMFVVTSFKDGKKRIITCPISGEPSQDYEGPTEEESGIEICIPVKREDVDAFVQNALNFYKYWPVRPAIIGVSQSKMDEYFKPIDARALFFGEKWTIRPAGYGKDEAVCVMGNVPYPIDWDQVKSLLRGERADKLKHIWSFLESNIVELRLPIGDIDFTPNREALQYTDHTLEGIAKVLCEIYDRIFDLITEKISKAKNLWDAMIIYNQLFHGNRVGSDTEKDALFAGDMNSIKAMLQNRLKWNGILINEGNFQDLEHWDENLGYIDNTSNNWSRRRGASDPVFFTYTRGEVQGKKIISKRPRRWHDSYITPSTSAMVVVHDIEKSSCIGASARYLLWEKHPNLHVVYFLRLSNKNVRKDFYEKYNFDSVPVTYVSDIQDEVKAFSKKNRVSTSAGGHRTPICAPYVDLSDWSARQSYRDDMNWNRETIKVSEIQGGLFVTYDHGDILLGERKVSKKYVHNLFGAYVNFCKFIGKKPGRIYGIHRRTVEAKWFKDEIRCRRWVPLEKAVANGLKDVDKNKVKKVDAFLEQVSLLRDSGYVGSAAAKKLIPLIEDKNSPMVVYCQEIYEDVPKYQDLTGIAKQFGLEGFTCTKEEVKTFPFRDQNHELQKRYPMIFKFSNSSAVQNCNVDENYYKLEKSDLDAIAQYVNSIDYYLTKKVFDIQKKSCRVQ